MKELKEAGILLAMVFLFMGGFAYGSMLNYVDNIDHCTSYKMNGITYEGYRAISEDNHRRCFWVENRYPYRVKHGI